MRDDNVPFLKFKIDSEAPDDPRLASMDSLETTGIANEESNLIARGGFRRSNGTDSESERRALGERLSVRAGVPTHSKSFADGTLLETVRDPQKPEAFRLLAYKNQKTWIVDQFEYDGSCFQSGEVSRNLGQHLRLSTGVNCCGQPREIHAELASTFCKYVDLPDGILKVIAAFVLCSWFPDRLRVAPYLWLVGPLSIGKSTILKLMQALCRRAFLIGDFTAASLYQLPSLLSPTLLIDEHDLGDSLISASIQRLLRIGNTPGTHVMRNGCAFDPYCLKVLAARQPPSDAALASRSVVLGTSPSTRRLGTLDEAALERIALEFQPKLLMFRLQNFHNLHRSDVFSSRIESMTSRMRDVADALAAPFLGDTELENGLITVLEQQDHDARIQQSIEPEWLIVEALYALCHHDDAPPYRFRRKINSILVGGIATAINVRMSERGEDVRLSARRVGAILRGLGISTKSLGNQGRGIELTVVVRDKVHELSRQFGFNRRNLLPLGRNEPEYGGAPCPLCEKFGLTAGLMFVALPEWKPARSINARGSLLDEQSTTMSTEPS